jgi:hypothetical protein
MYNNQNMMIDIMGIILNEIIAIIVGDLLQLDY